MEAGAVTEGNTTSWVPPGPTASPRRSLGQPALPDLERSPRWLASPNIKVLSLGFMAEQSLKDEKLEVLDLPLLPEPLRPTPYLWEVAWWCPLPSFASHHLAVLQSVFWLLWRSVRVKYTPCLLLG